MELAKYKACICEGSAEEAIIDILIDNNLLIFTREEMLEERVIAVGILVVSYLLMGAWNVIAGVFAYAKVFFTELLFA